MALRGQQLVKHAPHCWMHSHGCHTFATLPCQHADSLAPSYLLPNLKCHLVESNEVIGLSSVCKEGQEGGIELKAANSSNIARVLKNKLGNKRT